jgi:hypothetical protein
VKTKLIRTKQEDQADSDEADVNFAAPAGHSAQLSIKIQDYL